MNLFYLTLTKVQKEGLLSNSSLRIPCLKGESRSETNWGEGQSKKNFKCIFALCTTGRTLQSTLSPQRSISSKNTLNFTLILVGSERILRYIWIWKIDFWIEIKSFQSRSIPSSSSWTLVNVKITFLNTYVNYLFTV